MEAQRRRQPDPYQTMRLVPLRPEIRLRQVERIQHGPGMDQQLVGVRRRHQPPGRAMK